jgi:hypothetical protein
MTLDPEKERQIVQDQPPFLSSWAAVYAVVLGFLGVLVLLFELFTRHYR